MKILRSLIVIVLICSGINFAYCADKTLKQYGRTKILPKTGQGSSVSRTGDDGTYQAGNPTSPRFVDNGNGTISDRLSGLMWVQDPSQIPGGTWGSPGSPSSMTWNNAIDNSEALTYAGYSDWRLPNIIELESIVNYGGSYPAINGTYFLNTQQDYYWSSTTYNVNGSYALITRLDDGRTTNFNKGNPGYARPVRGGGL